MSDGSTIRVAVETLAGVGRRMAELCCWPSPAWTMTSLSAQQTWVRATFPCHAR